MDFNSDRFDPEGVKKKLASFTPIEIENPKFKKSAILIPIYPNNGDYKIIMTSRSSKLRHHRGEMSFPGGKFDPESDKSFQDTALRETREEIGIPEDNIEILGRLDDFPTITGYVIRPYVGVIKSPGTIKCQTNPDEVAAVVKIPIDFLFKPKLFNEMPFPHKATDLKVLSFQFTDPSLNQSFTIWGASAHILTMFLKTIFGYQATSDEYRRPTFEEIYLYLDTFRGKKKNSIKEKIMNTNKSKNEKKNEQ